MVHNHQIWMLIQSKGQASWEQIFTCTLCNFTKFWVFNLTNTTAQSKTLSKICGTANILQNYNDHMHFCNRKNFRVGCVLRVSQSQKCKIIDSVRSNTKQFSWSLQIASWKLKKLSESESFSQMYTSIQSSCVFVLTTCTRTFRLHYRQSSALGETLRTYWKLVVLDWTKFIEKTLAVQLCIVLLKVNWFCIFQHRLYTRFRQRKLGLSVFFLN